MIMGIPLKWVASYNDETLPETTADETSIRYIEISDVNEVDGITAAEILTFGDAPSRARRVVREGNVIVSTVRTYLRAVAAVGRDHHGAIASTGFAVLRAQTVDERFLKYAVLDRVFMDQVVARSTGVSYPAINASDLVRIRIPVPSVEEQQAIADYLDRETAQIDAFIAKNKELIALLTERRAATVNRAVTQGLKPGVETKSSGVNWLGDVPAHWTVAGLARFAKTVSGVGFPENEQGVEDAEIAFYKVNALGQADADGVIRKAWDTVSLETARRLRAKVLPPGTILLAKIGAALLLGRVRRTDRRACIDNNMMSVVPAADLDPRFASYALQTFDFEALANPGTVPSMDMYALMHRETAVPPLEEQVEIANYLDRRLKEIDSALQTSRRCIALARERRAALISAAVTGKMDVGVAA